MQNQSLLQGGIEGLETADPEIQEFLAKEADAESEEYEDAFYQEAEDEDNAVESHLTISQRLDRKISANMKPPAAGSYNESSSFATNSQEELAPSHPGSRTEKRQLKKQQMLDTMQKYREDHADFLRVVLIRNTNVKDRKMKFIPPPPNLPDLLRTASFAFNLRGKKRFKIIYDRDGNKIKDVGELHRTEENLLYLSCGEGWAYSPNKPQRAARLMSKATRFQEEEEDEEEEMQAEKEHQEDEMTPEQKVDPEQSLPTRNITISDGEEPN